MHDLQIEAAERKKTKKQDEQKGELELEGCGV